MIDHERRTVMIGGCKVRLSHRHFDLVSILARRPGVPFSRRQLMDLMNLSENASDMAICGHVKRTRKAWRDRGEECPIKTHYGDGYYWED